MHVVDTTHVIARFIVAVAAVAAFAILSALGPPASGNPTGGADRAAAEIALTE
jgi:hypothetical protein